MEFKDFLTEVRETHPDAALAPGDLVVFSYEVPVGGRLGERVRLAVARVRDWPLSCPSGPHISPRLGHPDGNVHASGFSTAWPPNMAVIGSASWNLGLDLDLNGINQELGGPSFAAINSRSYHPGGVDVLFGDGSSRFIKSSIDGMVWRALGTIAGGEVVSSDAY